MTKQWVFLMFLVSSLAAGCNNRPAESPADTNLGTEAGAPAVVPESPGAAPQATPPASSALQPGAAAGTVPPGQGANGTATLAPAPGQQAASASAQPSAPEAPPAPPAPRFRDVTVAAGTSLPLELTTALSSETATVEAPVRARLRRAIVVDGLTVLPVGTVLTGHVTDVARAGRVQGRARIAFSFTEATIDGTRESLRTNPLRFEAEATKGEDAKKIGIGAGIGAAIGAIAGGGDGAAKGAAIGGAAGTGTVLATRGREVELGNGADITATLASPITLRVEE